LIPSLNGAPAGLLEAAAYAADADACGFSFSPSNSDRNNTFKRFCCELVVAVAALVAAAAAVLVASFVVLSSDGGSVSEEGVPVLSTVVRLVSERRLLELPSQRLKLKFEVALLGMNRSEIPTCETGDRCGRRGDMILSELLPEECVREKDCGE
jgi:hypothetical protein